MYNQFFTIKPRISKKNGGSKVVHLILCVASYLMSRTQVIRNRWSGSESVPTDIAVGVSL